MFKFVLKKIVQHKRVLDIYFFIRRFMIAFLNSWRPKKKNQSLNFLQNRLNRIKTKNKPDSNSKTNTIESYIETFFSYSILFYFSAKRAKSNIKCVCVCGLSIIKDSFIANLKLNRIFRLNNRNSLKIGDMVNVNFLTAVATISPTEPSTSIHIYCYCTAQYP